MSVIWHYNAPRALKNNARICILDSSFNPPTLAHMELARQSLPQIPWRTCVSKGIRYNTYEPYDHHILLYSATNADKALKPGDATTEQRIEMIQSVAKQLESESSTNVSVGSIMDSPTFVKKAGVLSNLFTDTRPELFFIQGYDTVTRMFEPKYYQSEHVSGEEGLNKAMKSFFEEHNSRIVVAMRGRVDDEEIISFLDSISPWDAFINLMDLEPTVVGISSTEVRKAMQDNDLAHAKSLVPRSVWPLVHKYYHASN